MTGGDARAADARRLIGGIEGHLLVAATREEGRRAAARFATALDGLAPHQRLEVEERYASEYLALTRDSWRRTAERAGRLREEYEERYRALRRRLLAGCLLGWCVALGCLGALLPGRA
ncbi:hypothetical protein [Streptomyces sp. SID5606]|uniref:hypothetical protein n=1 Tax=Streptomyces sp. SID5606 TaxID=2690305 RepID=UPI001368E42D|nr:hypothetical protein [Streptomyces sp. SID5606]